MPNEPTYAFATVEEYEERQLAPLSEDEQALVGTLLDDAGLWLRQYVDVDIADAEMMDVLKRVNINMVKRAMVSIESNAYGVDQASATMGPFQQTMRYTNPNGDFYLTGAEKDLLGIDGSYLLSLPAAIGGYYGSNA